MSYSNDIRRIITRCSKAIYWQIERESQPPNRIVLADRTLSAAIHELRCPKDRRLTPLSNEEIARDLEILGLNYTDI